ncbi:MAG: DUF3458 domain-containing protein [Desulfobulbus sp.]|nr:DUF3458 domain-containing protein [Desulfobulbus sp.]
MHLKRRRAPFFMPIAVGLLDENGKALPVNKETGTDTQILILSQQKQQYIFSDIPSRPTVSILRNFSAPVRVHHQQSEEELHRLMTHDTDPFNRWDAGQTLSLQHILEQIVHFQSKQPITVHPRLVQGLREFLLAPDLDPAFTAMALTLPTENWIGQQMTTIDPVAIFTVRQQFRAQIGLQLHDELLRRYHDLTDDAPYRYNAREAGKRTLRNTCLGYLLAPEVDGQLAPELLQLGTAQYQCSDNMTDSIAALARVVNADRAAGTALLADFYTRWQHDPLIVDKWLALQAGCSLPGTLEHVRNLTHHPGFSIKNPNKVRALIATFCSTNHSQFHAADGRGYAFLGDQVIRLDPLNSQIAARMLTPLTQWRRYDQSRQKLMCEQLVRIARQPHLSDDVKEVVDRSLEKEHPDTK